MNTHRDVNPASLAFFVRSLFGKPQHLEAWLEVHSEEEIRDHILAYAEFMKGKPVLWKEDDE